MIEQSVQDHYEVLKLSSTDTTEEIKRSFRRLARQCHPDVMRSKDPMELQRAEARFKRISYAHDVLVDSAKRKEYDRQRGDSRQATMYSYGYGFVHDDVDTYQLTGTYPVDYDLAWDEFISRPFGWTEKSLRFYAKWEYVLGFALIVGAIVWFGTGHELSTLEMIRYLVTTRSMPEVESGIPFKWGLIGLMMSFAVTLASVVYALFIHPYSRRHNDNFKAQLINQACNMLAMLGVVFIAAGLIIGYNFF